MPYQSKFALEQDGRVTWLLDGRRRVLCFDRDLVAFGCARLTPGGYEMFPRPGLHWGPYGWFYPYWGNQLGRPEVMAWRCSARPDQGTFALKTINPKCGIQSEWQMAVSYDVALASYAYAVTATGRYVGGIKKQSYNPLIWEYFDLFPQGLFDYKTGPQFYRAGVKLDFPDPRWGYIVYQRSDDIGDYFAGRPEWMKVPLNRYVTSATGNIRVAGDGYVGFMNSPAGNPMVQLAEDTAAFTHICQCNWFYDIHFMHDRSKISAPPPQNQALTARFRIVNFNARRGAMIMDQARLPGYSDRERAEKRYPRYAESGCNSFETAVSLDVPDHSRVWQPFHHHIADYHPGVMRVDFHNTPENQCRWVTDCARTGAASLQVTTTRPGIAGWHLPYFDRPMVQPGRRYRLSVYIRTRNLQGAGATLGYFPGQAEHSLALSEKPSAAMKVRPIFAEHRVKGTSDWTRVEIKTPPLTAQSLGTVFDYDLRQCLIQPVLWHAGRGTTWFDDFRLEQI